MITSEDVDTLRQSGLSDVDILNKFKEYDPKSAEEIDTVLKSGTSPSDTLTKLVDFSKQFPDPPQQPSKGVGERLWDMGKSFVRGGANDAAGISSTVEHYLGGGDFAKGAKETARGVADTMGPGAKFDVLHPVDTAGELPNAVAESLPGMAGAVGTGALAGSVVPGLGTLAGGLAGAGIYGLGKYLGPSAEARAKNNNHPEVTTEDKLGAIPGATAQAGIEALGLKGLGGSALRAIGSQIASGAGSSVAGQLGTSVGTDKGASLDPHEVLNAAATAGITAGAIKGAEGIKGWRDNAPFRGRDQEAQNGLVDLMKSDRVSGDPTNPKESLEVLKNTHGILDSDIKNKIADLKANDKALQSENVSPDLIKPGLSESAEQAVTDALTNLKNKSVLSDEQVAKLRDALSGDETSGLLKNLLMKNEANHVESQLGKPTVTEGVDKATGGPLKVGAKLIGKLLQQGSTLGGGAGYYGLGPAGLAIAPAMMLAGRGFDALSSRPGMALANFSRRYGGQEAPTAPQPVVQPQEAPQAPIQPPAPPMDPAALQRAREITQAAQAAPVAPTSPVPQGNPAAVPPDLAAIRARLEAAQPAPQEQAPPQARPTPPPQVGKTVDLDRIRQLVAEQRAAQAAQAEAEGSRIVPAQVPQGQTNKARQKATKEVVAKPTVNDMADQAEARLNAAQAVLNDPTATPEAKAQAKKDKNQAAIELANLDVREQKGKRKSVPAGFNVVSPTPEVRSGNGFDKAPPTPVDLAGIRERLNGAQAAPEAAAVPPQVPQAPPKVTKGPDGVRVKLANGSEVFQATADNTHSHAAREAGTLERNKAQFEALESLKDLPGISNVGRWGINNLLPRLHENLSVNQDGTKTTARETINSDLLSKLPPEDATKVAEHLNNFTASNGRSLMNSFKKSGKSGKKKHRNKKH
jgi:hypothetical protein